MKRLLFVRPSGVYLPEIPAYRAFLQRYAPAVEALDSGESRADHDHADFDVIWRFMGLDRARLPTRCELVHEYGSLSTGACPRLRDRIKRYLNVRPGRRVFLNERVRAGFGFADPVPYCLRDMGVDRAFFSNLRAPEYDYVYAGSLGRQGVMTYLTRLVTAARDRRFLLIGELSQQDVARLGRHGNVTCTGRVDYREVPGLLASARIALNIVPDIYPFNLQTATKVLEYCALGLPVLSTRYAWVESFARTRGAVFGWLPRTPDATTLRALEHTAFVTPDVADLEWDRIIAESGVFSFLGLASGPLSPANAGPR